MLRLLVPTAAASAGLAITAAGTGTDAALVVANLFENDNKENNGNQYGDDACRPVHDESSL